MDPDTDTAVQFHFPDTDLLATVIVATVIALPLLVALILFVTERGRLSRRSARR